MYSGNNIFNTILHDCNLRNGASGLVDYQQDFLQSYNMRDKRQMLTVCHWRICSFALFQKCMTVSINLSFSPMYALIPLYLISRMTISHDGRCRGYKPSPQHRSGNHRIDYNRVGLDLKNCEIINNKRTKEKFAIGKSWFIDDDIGTFGLNAFHNTLNS